MLYECLINLKIKSYKNPKNKIDIKTARTGKENRKISEIQKSL